MKEKVTWYIELRNLLLLLLIVSVVSLAYPPTVSVWGQGHSVLILSSLQNLAPIRDSDLSSITTPLMNAGFSITYLTDNQVTINILLHQLNKYDVIIWRTNTYTFGHTTFWYVGESINDGCLQEYSSEFSSNELDASHGIVGAGITFFQNHIMAGSLSHEKLTILVSSLSNALAGYFLTGGSQSVVEFTAPLSLTFGLVDSVVGTLMYYLTNGYNVSTALQDTLAPYLTMKLADPLDTSISPPIAFVGDGTVTIM